jgi:trans-aconitate 2-methyltransferase
MADGWDPGTYDRFRDERRQPFRDLVALVVPVPGGRVVDLGCGTGELTADLHRQLRAADTLGVDRSASMLKDSAAHAGNGVHFETGDIATFQGSDYDVVFANASLHWVEGHEALLARLAGALGPGGQLAFQVPANHDHPSHTVAAQLAKEAPFAKALAPGDAQRDRPWNVLLPEDYATRLDELDFVDQHVRLQVYGHHLASTEDVVEWVKGTLLTQYRERLPPDTYEEFLTRYRQRLLSQLGDHRPYFYAFKRILCWARLGGS